MFAHKTNLHTHTQKDTYKYTDSHILTIYALNIRICFRKKKHYCHVHVRIWGVLAFKHSFLVILSYWYKNWFDTYFKDIIKKS